MILRKIVLSGVCQCELSTDFFLINGAACILAFLASPALCSVSDERGRFRGTRLEKGYDFATGAWDACVGLRGHGLRVVIGLACVLLGASVDDDPLEGPGFTVSVAWRCAVEDGC